MNRRHFIGGAIVAATLGTGGSLVARRDGVAAASPAANGLEAPSAAERLFSLSLPDPNGLAHSFDAWRGKVLVVNFWATWCAPCVIEMPELQTLHIAYPDAQFVGIGVDSTSNIRQFLEKTPVGYPVVAMETGAIELMRSLGNTAAGLPFTLILGADGEVFGKILGKINPDRVSETVSRALAGRQMDK